MVTLTDFLLARIAEDEAVARAVLESHDPLPPWVPGDFGDTGAWQMGAGDGPSGYTSVIVDAARVLAECEAKRQMVADYLTFQRVSDERAEGTPLPQALTAAGLARGLWHALQILALPYADHPDYRQEWKP